MKKHKKFEYCAKKENICVSINERTDTSGSKVANIVIEVLKNDQMLSEKSFLLSFRKCLQ
jgi:hypothetical protein